MKSSSWNGESSTTVVRVLAQVDIFDADGAAAAAACYFVFFGLKFAHIHFYINYIFTEDFYANFYSCIFVWKINVKTNI